PDRLAPNQDFSAVGLVESVKNAHQGRLAGAVFADDACDRAPPHRQANVAVGVNLAEPLLDVAQLDRRWLVGRFSLDAHRECTPSPDPRAEAPGGCPATKRKRHRPKAGPWAGMGGDFRMHRERSISRRPIWPQYLQSLLAM